MEDIRIFLSGFHENEFEKIRLAIQTAGGVSLSQLTSSVTVSDYCFRFRKLRILKILRENAHNYKILG